VPLYERSLRILERLAAQDPQDRQTSFDLAARYGKLGDALWQADPKRAMELYDRALATARALVSKQQFGQLHESYLLAISRPLILLRRTAEARRGLAELLAQPPSSAYLDRLGAEEIKMPMARVDASEGKSEEAIRMLDEAIAEGEKLRTEHPNDLTAIFVLSNCYREFASITKADRRSAALQHSAAAWHAWPATPFTQREEQQDLVSR
jgi:tetratricopeptide (TPR) repeat protein